MMIWNLDEGHPSLLQLFQPPVGHPRPKYIHVSVHGGLHDYFIVYGSIIGHESSICVIYVGQEAVVSAMNVKIMYMACQSCVRGPLCLKRPSAKLIESLESYVRVILLGEELISIKLPVLNCKSYLELGIEGDYRYSFAFG